MCSYIYYFNNQAFYSICDHNQIKKLSEHYQITQCHYRLRYLIQWINNKKLQQANNKIMQPQKKHEKNKKELSNFKKYIHAQLKDFEKCREWADINNWLHNLYKNLQNKHFQQLPNAIILAKRLAQCLTNTLPSGVHEYALKVYTLILTNFDDQQNIRPLMSIGLFPFFQVSSSQLKFQLLKIYENFFLNDVGCLQMIISLMNSLLTGLNENNQELAKKIFALCEKISKRYGYIWVDGAVWVNILKSSKVKIAGFKYFMKVFKDRDKERNNKQELKNTASNKQQPPKPPTQQPTTMKQPQQPPTRQKKPSITISKRTFTQSSRPNNTHHHYLKQQQLLYLSRLYQQKHIQDSPHNRYPNFSTLVVSAIRSCLQGQVDSLAKRAALEHLSTYLKLGQSYIASENDALVLVSSMLRVLTCKQFSLTRRIYLYLFDQPDTQGHYLISPQQRSFQLNILISSIKKMLRQTQQQRDSTTNDDKTHNHKSSIQSTLSIIEILIQDHEKLGGIILPQLAYDILRFVKKSCFSRSKTVIGEMRKKVFEFNQLIIGPYNMIFLSAILKQVTTKDCNVNNDNKESAIHEYEQLLSGKRQKDFVQVIKILDFYIYTLYKAKYQVTSSGHHNNKGSIKKSSSSNQQDNHTDVTEELKQICLLTLESILSFLKASKLKYQRLNSEALDLANKINIDTLAKLEGFQLNENIVQKIDDLIELGPGQGVFARLLTLHPSPRKEILLPCINDGPFAVVCLQNLLPPLKSRYDIELTSQQQKKVFYAIFKLLECHLWQQQAFQLVKIFIVKFPNTFKQQIDRVQGSQWLIYWRLAGGDVEGGTIRMILNAQSQNPLKKHMSCKWIEANDHIISKIIEPISAKLKACLQNYDDYIHPAELEKEIELIFNLIRIVFQASNESFDRFFFLQKERYLMPLLELVFINLEIGSQKLKSKSMDMMKYVLSKAKYFDEKYDYFNSTLPRVLNLFKTIISRKIGSQQINSQVLEQRIDKLNRKNSHDGGQTQLYLQEIQIMEYLANLNVSLRNSLKDKEFRSQAIIELFESKGMYVMVIKGFFQSDLPYIRTLYLDFLKDSCDLLARSQKSKDLLSILINLILQKLFLILKTQDVSKIEQTIRDKKDSTTLKSSIHRTRRLSSSDIGEDLQKAISLTKQPTNSFYIESKSISKNDMNIEAKYAQLIEMWNSVKFYTKFSIEKGIKNLPIVNLLSLILQSFPFSYLKYSQLNPSGAQSQQALSNYQTLQQQIRKVTGLKKQVMQIIDIVWSKFNVQICQFLMERGDPRILIHCTIEPMKVLATISSCSSVKEVGRYYGKGRINLGKGWWHYSGEILQKQNQISYFLYLYLTYCNFTLVPSKSLQSFLDLLISLFRALRPSQHVQTKLWIFELIHLISQRLINYDLHSQSFSKIKAQLQQLTKQTLDCMLKTIIKPPKFTFKTQIKTGFISNLFGKQELQVCNFDFIKMNPPTIFEMSEVYSKRHHKRHNNNGEQHLYQHGNDWRIRNQQNNEGDIREQNELIDSCLFERWLNLDQQTFSRYLGICCLKTLIAISCPVVISILEKDLVRISQTLKQIMLSLLPLCEDKSIDNQMKNQLISEYIFTVLQNQSLRAEILPLIRRNVLGVFMANDFFKTTKRSLFYWKQIIDATTLENSNYNNDLLGELLARESGLFEGLLKGREEVLRQKIKSFQRVCFVIYSGNIDKYEGKLATVLLFLNEVMKQQNSSPALLILMLFCIRILFMRLSQTSLNKMFKSIWPGLISILIQIFNSKDKRKNKNINLILAALKVIELIHALEMEEFNFHKWIFITDFFGIKIEPLQGEINDERKQKSQLLTPFVFKPYLTNLLPQYTFKCEYLPVQVSVRNTMSQRKQKRKILIKQASIDTIEQLQNLAYILMQYMIDCNQKRVQVSKTQIEQLIEADFISLDDYIFQVK